VLKTNKKIKQLNKTKRKRAFGLKSFVYKLKKCLEVTTSELGGLCEVILPSLMM
jgi:hypothetical protein